MSNLRYKAKEHSNAIIKFIEGQRYSIVAQQYSPIALIANDALRETSFVLWKYTIYYLMMKYEGWDIKHHSTH